MKAVQLITSIILLGFTGLAMIDEGTLSFRLPFICVSFLLAAVIFCEFLDSRD